MLSPKIFREVISDGSRGGSGPDPGPDREKQSEDKGVR